MEDGLDVSLRPYDPHRPQVGMDQISTQLLADVRAPLPIRPGAVAKEDHEYERNGTCKVLLAFEPLRAWRTAQVTQRRTKHDWAHWVKWLVDVHYPDAEVIVLVVDKLNTHTPASLYEAFPPTEAKRIADTLEIHYPPNHGSWLNMAEIELSSLRRQCLDRRVSDQATLTHEIAAWEQARNVAAATVAWRFTTADARIRLKKLYPSIDA